LRDLVKIGLWDDRMKKRLIANGSIQDKRFRNTSKTCTELHGKSSRRPLLKCLLTVGRTFVRASR
jgi:hypothetical protein